MNVRNGLRGLVGTLCGACIVTLVALGFSAAPARAQTIPTCVTVRFDAPNPVPQFSTVNLVPNVFQQTTPPSTCDSSLSLIPDNAAVISFISLTDHNDNRVSCEAPGALQEVLGDIPFVTGDVFNIDTGTVGTFGYEMEFIGNSSFGLSVSPCIDVVVTPPCTGAVSIAADRASGDGMPFAGTTNEWTVQLHIHACQDITALKAQGGTEGWETVTIPNENTSNPSFGSVISKVNNKNQVITWTLADLGQGTAGGADATLLLDIKGTIGQKTTPFTILDLLGSWSLSYSLGGVQQKIGLSGTATVTVEPPL